MTEEKVSRGTGIRYHLSTKLQAVTDYVQGMRKKDILERVGCRRNVLDLWIKKYGDEVRKNLAAAAEPAAEPVAEAVAEPVAEAVALADLVRLPKTIYMYSGSSFTNSNARCTKSTGKVRPLREL